MGRKSGSRRKYPDIGVLYGGSIYHLSPWEGVFRHTESIDVYKILQRTLPWRRRLDLSPYDIAIVGWAPDQIFLKENELEIQRFLRMGGVLIGLGEFDLNWVPNTRYMRGFFNDIEVVDATDTIFLGLKPEDVSNWDDSAHGYFTSIPTGALCIASVQVDGQARCVGFIDTSTYAGSILAMTMDPDFHTYNEVPAARTMLRNISDWAIREYHRISDLEIRRPGAVRMIGYRVRPFAVELVAALVAGILTTIVVYFLLKLIAP